MIYGRNSRIFYNGYDLRNYGDTIAKSLMKPVAADYRNNYDDVHDFNPVIKDFRRSNSKGQISLDEMMFSKYGTGNLNYNIMIFCDGSK